MRTTSGTIPAPLASLRRNGVALWLDDLSRERLTSGSLARLVDTRGIVGVTSNPTIFADAMGSSDAYTDDLRRLASAGATAEEAARRLTVDDVRDACDLLAPIAERTDGVDGRVSLEVDPRLAHDTQVSVEEARELWALVDRPNLFIKIPATQAGLPAITRCIADGVSVNVTLIFSLERYEQVMNAYMSGLEQRLTTGASLDGLESVASFFVSRVDTEVDKRLEAIGSDEALELRGRAALANARLAYQRYEERLRTERWLNLSSAGASEQRPLWASTSVKNPDYPEEMYVAGLVAADTVVTMPESTLHAIAELPDLGGGTVTGSYDDARAVLDALDEVGVDMDDVTALLEREGVQKFSASWDELLDTVGSGLRSSR
jgi:transaldolase